jgi:hypothetical protein
MQIFALLPFPCKVDARCGGRLGLTVPMIIEMTADELIE